MQRNRHVATVATVEGWMRHPKRSSPLCRAAAIIPDVGTSIAHAAAVTERTTRELLIKSEE
ncbi:MAG: hypothetical protein QHD01_02110 [Bradyrhizobium sp.]|uniref:hypothetical protein n=1 Tax=Bradyrhizobium sp. TaxID=376 RepID=UPI0029AEE142|nr:hypothetical protein [Bradyrhizobium sp.]MDX3965376.1 hypothetical protein [Bradyrhizobium sp.]